MSQRSDTSINRQKRHIREYADTHGFELLDILDDGSMASGFDKNRDKYEELVSRARNKEMDAIIINDRDRLGRDRWVRMQHFSEFVQLDIEVHTYFDGFLDPDSDIALIQEAVHANQDDIAKRKEINRSKQAIEERMSDGYFQGRPPFGLRINDDTKLLEIEPDEWARCQQIWESGEYNGTTEWRVLKRGRAHYEELLEQYG